MKIKSVYLLKSSPAISDKNGNLMSYSDMDRILFVILENLFEN